MKRPDDDLRQLFLEEKRTDEERAPSFERVLARAPSGRFSGSRRNPRVLAAAAAAAAVVAAAIFVPSLRRTPEAPPARIETWKAPTDFLLERTSPEVFETIPALSSPPPDYAPLLDREKGSKS